MRGFAHTRSSLRTPISEAVKCGDKPNFTAVVHHLLKILCGVAIIRASKVTAEVILWPRGVSLLSWRPIRVGNDCETQTHPDD